jgi:hypothetical protein
MQFVTGQVTTGLTMIDLQRMAHAIPIRTRGTLVTIENMQCIKMITSTSVTVNQGECHHTMAPPIDGDPARRVEEAELHTMALQTLIALRRFLDRVGIASFRQPLLLPVNIWVARSLLKCAFCSFVACVLIVVFVGMWIDSA